VRGYAPTEEVGILTDDILESFAFGTYRSFLSILRPLGHTIHLHYAWFRLEFPPPSRKFRPAGKRHLLLLCGSIPPTNAVGTLRPMSFARYAATNGWSVHVAGFRAPPAPDEVITFGAELVPPEARVTEVAETAHRGSWRLSPRVDGGFHHALRLAAALKTAERPSIVLATGPRFALFVAGLFVAKHFRVPLVLDYRDEWNAGSVPFVEHGRWNRYFERRCLAAASAVLFATEGFRRSTAAKWPALAGPRWQVLPNGYEPSAATENHRPRVDRLGGFFRFVFTGNLADALSPERFIDTVERAAGTESVLMARTRFRFVGRKSDAAVRRIQASPCRQLFELAPPVPWAEVSSEFATADGLLMVFGPGWEGARATKLYEYMAQAKPILYFGPVSESSEVIEQTAAGFVVKDRDSSALLRALEACMSRATSSWDTVERRAWAAQHTRAAIAKSLFRILNDVQS
jgi:hypothetical protein